MIQNARGSSFTYGVVWCLSDTSQKLCARSSTERETLYIRAAQGEREEGREEGRSAEEGRVNVHGVRVDANASSRVRWRGCYLGAERRERGGGGRKTSEEEKGEG